MDWFTIQSGLPDQNGWLIEKTSAKPTHIFDLVNKKNFAPTSSQGHPTRVNVLSTVMSDRANYAIIFRKKLNVYYAAWGGPTIQRELKDGPTACENFIRKQERVRNKRFLEFAFMEGAIALDKDHKRALFFGGPGDINYNPNVQKRLVERLRLIWEREGWTIAWAPRYAYDFIKFLGFPGTDIENEFYLGEPAEWSSIIAEPLEWVSTIFAFQNGNQWEMHASQSPPGTLVHFGQKLVESKAELPQLPALDLTSAGSVTTFVFDEKRRSLVIVAPLFGALNAPHLLTRRAQKAFPGWTVELDMDVPLPWKRLKDRGIPITLAEEPEQDEPLTEAEIDAYIDEALVYAPEEQIAVLEDAKEAMIANITDIFADNEN